MSGVGAEAYKAAAAQVRGVADMGAEVIRRSADIGSRNASGVTHLATIDLSKAVSTYYEVLQRSVKVNGAIAAVWAELAMTLSEQVREYARSFTRTLVEQGERVADHAVEQSRKVEEIVDEHAERIARAAREQELAAKRAHREEAKAAKAKIREKYDGLTKSELADQLAERDLPRSGNVDELIERLVAAEDG